MLDRLSEKVEIPGHGKQGSESMLVSMRQENIERQQARDVFQARSEDKTRKLEEKSWTLEENALALNRVRSELNEEKKKSRQALAAIADKNKQFESVQQQCARQQESLSSQRR